MTHKDDIVARDPRLFLLWPAMFGLGYGADKLPGAFWIYLPILFIIGGSIGALWIHLFWDDGGPIWWFTKGF